MRRSPALPGREYEQMRPPEMAPSKQKRELKLGKGELVWHHSTAQLPRLQLVFFKPLNFSFTDKLN